MGQNRFGVGQTAPLTWGLKPWCASGTYTSPALGPKRGAQGGARGPRAAASPLLCGPCTENLALRSAHDPPFLALERRWRRIHPILLPSSERSSGLARRRASDVG